MSIIELKPKKLTIYEGEYLDFKVIANPYGMKAITDIPKEQKCYMRGDHQVIIIKDKLESNGLNSFYYLERIEYNQVAVLHITSEMELVNLDDSFDETVINKLLEANRLLLRVNNYNGYVGYINKAGNICTRDM